MISDALSSGLMDTNNNLSNFVLEHFGIEQKISCETKDGQMRFVTNYWNQSLKRSSACVKVMKINMIRRFHYEIDIGYSWWIFGNVSKSIRMVQEQPNKT